MSKKQSEECSFRLGFIECSVCGKQVPRKDMKYCLLHRGAFCPSCLNKNTGMCVKCSPIAEVDKDIAPPEIEITRCSDCGDEIACIDRVFECPECHLKYCEECWDHNDGICYVCEIKKRTAKGDKYKTAVYKIGDKLYTESALTKILAYRCDSCGDFFESADDVVVVTGNITNPKGGGFVGNNIIMKEGDINTYNTKVKTNPHRLEVDMPGIAIFSDMLCKNCLKKILRIK